MADFRKAVVSWSHTDPDWTPEQAEQRAADVHELANLLRSKGIEVELDLHQSGGMDWARFGPRLITEQDRAVIVIASAAWRQAWEGSGDPTIGAGAAGEANTLYSEFITDRDAFTRRIFLVVLPGTTGSVIPSGLAHVQRVRLETLDEAGIVPLLRELLGQPRFVAEPVGELPILPTAPSREAARHAGDGDGGAGAAPLTAGYRFRPLPQVPEVSWSLSRDPYRPVNAMLAVHVSPEPARPLTRRELTAARAGVGTLVRRHELISDMAPVNIAADSARVSVVLGEERYDRGVVPSAPTRLTLLATGQVTVEQSLPRDSMGSVVDGVAVAADVARSLRMASLLLPADAVAFTVAVEIGPTTMITAGTVAQLGRNSASMLKTGSSPLQLPPDEAVETTDLGRDADGIARELLPGIMSAWEYL